MSKAPPAYVYTGRQAVWPRTILERRLTSDMQARPSRFDAPGSAASNRSRPATIKLWRCTTACCSLLSSADPIAKPTPRLSRNRAIDRGVTHTRALRYASLRPSGSSRWKDPEQKREAFIQPIGMNAHGICKYCSCLFSRRFLLYLIVLPIPGWNLWEPSSHPACRYITQPASRSYCGRRIYQLLMHVVALLNYRWPIECYLLACVR